MIDGENPVRDALEDDLVGVTGNSVFLRCLHDTPAPLFNCPTGNAESASKPIHAKLTLAG